MFEGEKLLYSHRGIEVKRLCVEEDKKCECLNRNTNILLTFYTTLCQVRSNLSLLYHINGRNRESKKINILFILYIYLEEGNVCPYIVSTNFWSHIGVGGDHT